MLSHFTCHFYVSDDVVYGGAINNRHGPNEQHAKSVNVISWIGNVKSLVLA